MICDIGMQRRLRKRSSILENLFRSRRLCLWGTLLVRPFLIP